MRPTMFDEKKTEAVTLKLSASLLEAADGVAKYRGMERSEYLRWLVEQGMARAKARYEVLASIFGKPEMGSKET